MLTNDKPASLKERLQNHAHNRKIVRNGTDSMGKLPRREARPLVGGRTVRNYRLGDVDVRIHFW